MRDCARILPNVWLELRPNVCSQASWDCFVHEEEPFKSLSLLTVRVDSPFNVVCRHHEHYTTEFMEKKSSLGHFAASL
jgi:hypothetical protein